MTLVQLFYRDRDTHERHFVAQSEYDEAGGRSEHDRVFAWVRKQQRRMIDAGANPAEWEVVHWNPGQGSGTVWIHAGCAGNDKDR